jgi:hypothetical protein
MAEVMADELGCLSFQPPPVVRTTGVGDAWRAVTTLRFTELPVMQPGQLWLVELPTSGPELAPFEYRALSTANVLVYDRALAPTVARHLPLGSYAEPAALDYGRFSSASERCLRFAQDGWSVARLLQPRLFANERLEVLGQLTRRFPAHKLPADLPVRMFVARGRDRYEKSEIPLHELGSRAANASALSSTLTIVLDVTEAREAPRFAVTPANGLAG